MGKVSKAMTREDLDKLAHGIAYDACCTMIESNCVMVLGLEVAAFPFFDVSAKGCDEYALDQVEESVRYLDARGLIVRHEDNAYWIQLQDESEATA